MLTCGRMLLGCSELQNPVSPALGKSGTNLVESTGITVIMVVEAMRLGGNIQHFPTTDASSNLPVATQSPETSGTPTPPTSTADAGADDRREGPRMRTVLRIAPVAVGNQQGLARVRNISDGGMKLDLTLPILLGDRVRVELSEDVVLMGAVVWTNGDECGLKFDQPIDSIAALRESSDATRAPGARPPRLPTDISALVVTERGPSAVKVQNVSQRGMKIVHDGSFTPGLHVRVRLPSGIERRGVVRWIKDDAAGLMLTDHLTVRELGNVNEL